MLTTLADATDLGNWANRVAATGDLPDLVRRLLLLTVSDLNRARVRAGEGTRYPGWDGFVESASGTAYVPSGLSVWEMGTDRGFKKKAETDLTKRIEDPLGAKPEDCTFVFVTPRRWRDKDAWAEEKTDEGPWREVRVLDADDLQGWLVLSPVTHAWISSKMGKAPEQVEDLSSYWLDWSGATAPVLSSDVIVAGRVAGTKQVVDFLHAQPSVRTVQGDSQEEALAFIAAALAQLPEPERSAVLDRALIVREATAWREVVACEQPLILLPTFSAFEGGGRARDRHHVLAPVGREVAPDAAASMITLSAVRREAVTDALQALGVPQQRAEALAARARRNLLSVRRGLALNRELQQPVWARPGVSRALIAAMLVGAWDESFEGDCAVVGQLAADDYNAVAAQLAQLAQMSDPPLRRIGRTWIVNSREDAWNLLSRYLTAADVERLQSACATVFATPDPALTLPPDERWMASVRGKVRVESRLLSGSLADTLALAAVASESVPVAGVATGGELSAIIVHRVLRQANEDLSGNLWRSLDSVLPTFAEAAPNEFLVAVDANLNHTQSSLLEILREASGTSFGSRWYHSGLLWAFERLAWSPQYLVRCTLALGRLAEVPLDRRVGNNPIDTLRSTFLPWLPQTEASVEQRNEALDVLRQRQPVVAWRLMMSLLPRDGDIASHSDRVRWRGWGPAGDHAVTMAEYWQVVKDILAIIIEQATTNIEYLAEVIGQFAQFSADAREEILGRLTDIDPQSVDPAVRLDIAARLRGVVSQHRRFPDAKWAMERTLVDRLAAVYEHWQPDDVVDRLGWLLTDYPHLIDPPTREADFERYGEAQRQAQLAAVREIYGEQGIQGILRAAEHNLPTAVGRVVAADGLLAEGDESIILGFLGSDILWQRQLAMAFVAAKTWAPDGNAAWVEEKLGNGAGWKPSQTADFLRSSPATAATWRRLEAYGDDVRQLYWESFPPFGPRTVADYEFAARQLIAYGRAWTAADMLAMASHGEDRIIDPMLVLETLEAALGTPLGEYAEDGNLGYDVGRLLDLVNAATGLPEDRLATIEFGLLPLFRFERRPMKVLHRRLATDPQFFAQILALAYRGESDTDVELTEQEKAQGTTAYYLLDGWHLVPGGAGDGSIDAADLNTWVDTARGFLAASERTRIGDQRIGHVLKYAQPDPDGTWPPLAVRDLIERVGSNDIVTGFVVEERNSRGVTGRSLSEGGLQERVLAAKYRASAEPLAKWPQTAAMLLDIANSYEAQARHEDEEVELRQNLE